MINAIMYGLSAFAVCLLLCTTQEAVGCGFMVFGCVEIIETFFP